MHLVRDFATDIILTNGDKGGNLKKLLGILHMNIQYGDRLHLQISGEDEEVACQEMQAFMAQNLCRSGRLSWLSASVIRRQKPGKEKQQPDAVPV